MSDKEARALIFAARKLLTWIGDVDASAPEELTLKELCRVAKSAEKLRAMVDALADALEESADEIAGLEEDVATLQSQVDEMESQP